jgi:YD repeat-containing protein
MTSDTSGTSYSWNSDGRLTGRSGVLGTLAWNYDYAGRVTSMTLNDGTTLTYNMDGDGRVQNGARKGMAYRYLLDGRDVLREWVRTTTTYTMTAGSVALRVRDLERLQGLTYPVGSQQAIDYTHGHGYSNGLTVTANWKDSPPAFLKAS